MSMIPEDFDNRTTVIIDGQSLYSVAKTLAFEVDFKRLHDYFRDRTNLKRIYHAITLFEDGDNDFSPLRPLADWLNYNGFTLIEKRAYTFTDDAGRRRVIGKGMEVDITVQMIRAAEWSDHIVLFSGSGDLTPAVDYVREKGVRVTVVNTIKGDTPFIADSLRRAADTFVDLSEHFSDIAKVAKN